MKVIILIIALSFASVVNSAVLVGQVVGVTDGDTITLLDATHTQYKVRLSGIDAPEKKQAFGQSSKKSLSDLVYLKVVSVEYSKQDRYGRIVGKVLLNDVDVNLEQVKRGMAWFYKKYQNEQPLQDRLDYLHAQETAEAERVGLWVDSEVVAPWDFRKQN
jgi:endonuclease YncB( thermonuclease family)